MAPIRSERRSAKRDTLVVKCTNPPKLSYRYRRLQHPDEIRLLVLGPGTSSKPLDCKLIHTRMSLTPEYEALSYAWGDSSKPRQIHCNNRAINVTESLYSALRHIRDPIKSRTIWADAICINQHVDAEKNHQVALMGKIYSQAERTLAWIGEEEDDVVHDAFDFLERLDRWLCGSLEGYSTKKLQNRIHVPQQVLGEFQSDWVPGFYRYLGPLFRRPWFTRLWIVQEVVLAKAVDIVFGTRILSLDKILLPVSVLVLSVTLRSIPDGFDVNALANLFRIAAMRESRSTANADRGLTAMLDALSHGAYFDISDPRDRIYALLGLRYTPGFVADYTLSIDDVFQSFAICLASWVPTFNSSHSSLHGRRLAIIHHFHASKSSISDSNSPTPEKSWRISGESVLDLKTADIDEIGTIARLPLESRMDETLPALKEIFETAKCSKSTLTNERYYKLCQAVTIDVDRFGDEASPEQVEWSDQLFKVMLDRSVTGEDFQSADITLDDVHQVQVSFLNGKRFCLTSHDRFAWIPELSEVGDKICILQGGRVPLVVRPRTDGKYTLIGESWVQGMMNGEALDLPNFEWRDISVT
ncbi:heterokaryon incompatibility -domain-containing protein [Rutstroemia sp. NJR-2017a BBW]|nr:heterokaryon incompatibility -domain-containing protein [Rutstroemia sp. NJR-2017a BBW]